MNKKILISLLFLVCLGVGAAAPFYVLTKEATVALVKRGSAVDAVYATAIVEPTIMVPIAARTTARLVVLSAVEGQTVKKGDILARLEDAEQQAAIADLKAKLGFAEANLARKRQLLRTQSISRDILESAEADVKSLNAQIDKATAQASYLTLIAPADGLIIKRDGEIGELINASTPIFYMSCCAPLRLTAEVDEEDIPQVKVDQDVLIQADAFPNQIFNGRVASITPKGDPVARSYRVRIAFSSADVPFLIGMTTEANIIIKKVENTLLIPISALGKGGVVQQAVNGQIKTVPVKTGIQNVDTIEVVSGLNEKDSVVIPFHDTWSDGQKVRVTVSQEKESAR